MGRLIRKYVDSILNAERQFTPFTIKHVEYKLEIPLRVNDELTVNIKQVIDRVDEVPNPANPAEKLLRIVDYKTGGDKNNFKTVAELFDATLTDRRKAILQLLFYCHAYAKDQKLSDPIQPILYIVSSVMTDKLQPVKLNKKELKDYRPLDEEFMNLFRAKLEEMFDPNVPFRTAANDHACMFCKFKNVCSRADENSAGGSDE